MSNIVDIDTDRFVVLLSHERSGSHYLSNMLVDNSDVISLDEICNFDAVQPNTSPASFLRFRYERQRENPDFALRPDASSITRLFDLYLEHLAELVPNTKKKIWLDIKYGHVHNFEIFWWPTERRPFLPRYLEQRNVRVVHLKRRDSLSATVSSLIAEKTGVWHKRDAETAGDPSKIHLPVVKVVHDALSLEREKENFYSWLASNRCFDVEYEDLSGTEAARNSVMSRLCDFLGVDAPAEFPSSYRKVTPPLEEVVGNYEELVRIARLFGRGRLRI